MMESEKIREGVKNILWIYFGIIMLLAILYFVYPESYGFFSIMIEYLYKIIEGIVSFTKTIIELSFETYSNIYYVVGIVILATTFVAIVYKLIFGKNQIV